MPGSSGEGAEGRQAGAQPASGGHPRWRLHTDASCHRFGVYICLQSLISCALSAGSMHSFAKVIAESSAVV